MSRRLRIAIVTNGRFYVCDLARELSHLGHDVAFYSLVPPWRTKRFGLPDQCNRWLLPRVLPEFAVNRLSKHLCGPETRWQTERRFIECFDRVVAQWIEPCDVIVAMSGLFNRTVAVARKRFGSKCWIERASRH